MPVAPRQTAEPFEHARHTAFPDPLPNTFVTRALEQYGVSWSQLGIIIGAVASYLGLQDSINAGIWIGGTVAGLVIVVPFRQYISSNFLAVALCCLALAVVFLIAPLGTLFWYGQLSLEFFKKNRDWDTLYASLAVSIPLGICVLSYRQQEEFSGLSLPASVRNALRKSVTQADFVLERASYTITLFALTDTTVRVRCDAELRIRNRSRQSRPYNGAFDPAGQDKKFHSASIGTITRDPDDPELLAGRGISLPYTFAPKESVTAKVSFESTFRSHDSEFYGVYRPTAEFVLLVRKLPDGLTCNVQEWLGGSAQRETKKNGDRSYVYKDGLLPYHGIRLFWHCGAA